tara:strand:+ start:466 stop:585 length:120 start_codon:yes stop_codon:yes gene_type:complete
LWRIESMFVFENDAERGLARKFTFTFTPISSTVIDMQTA